jgi:polyisoprenyl-teichoic acid--peptidoglycan teichoic acid transferase
MKPGVRVAEPFKRGTSRDLVQPAPAKPAVDVGDAPDAGLPTATPDHSAGTGPDRPKRARRHRSPLWAKLLVVVGALVMVAALASIGLVNEGIHQIDKSVASAPLLGDAAVPNREFSGTAISGPINILLVGSDLRANQTDGGHSDTIIIAHIPASHDRVYLVSIPRDLGVRIPPFAKTHYPGGSDKINAAFVYGSRDGAGDTGGFQLLATTITSNFGVRFNGGAIVDFAGFTDILWKLGGVTMYVDETTYSIHYGINVKTGKPAKPYHINPNTGVPYCSSGSTFDRNPLQCALPGIKPNIYPKGMYHFTPSQALDFVRARDGLVGTDYGRQRHQQQFIKAVVQEAYNRGLSDPFKLNSFISSIGKALVFDRNGISLTDWIFTLKGITPSGIVAIKTNGGQTVDYDGSAGRISGSVQSLNADSKALLAAVSADKTATDDHVETFLQTHSDWMA